ncbi:hypothetical protein ACFWBC_04605 [Streptomyces sp. NPDC059985]|uniref:hypothetical protein n=1 Tax=Streptomyces sp. NPDC059985 TaxID=3347025 RepID=UPI0036A99FBA
MIKNFHDSIFPTTVPVSGPKVAELAKLIENTFRLVNISMINELGTLTDRLGVNIWEAIDAAATKPFGFTRFTPGPGVGGHCLPVDPPSSPGRGSAWAVSGARSTPRPSTRAPSPPPRSTTSSWPLRSAKQRGMATDPRTVTSPTARCAGASTWTVVVAGPAPASDIVFLYGVP